jgi:ubiquinone/menaquinone biosynthesis C-methylase UbiE
MRSRIKKAVKALLYGDSEPVDRKMEYSSKEQNVSSSDYWTSHNVTGHKQFSTREESLHYMRWRFDIYPHYEQLMPCNGFDGKVILDYGCGPGHDVVGFLEYSKPKKVIAMDVSSSSLEETSNRVKLHGGTGRVDVKLIKEKEPLPIEDSSIDYIHSSGVLHHTPNMPEILNEFHRILKPKGIIRIMVYNYNSIWAHLYVPYVLQIVKKIDSNLSLADAFRRSTDGVDCPISNFYTPEEYLDICAKSQLKGVCTGVSIGLEEMEWVHTHLFKAMGNIKFPEVHRNFLKEITFNQQLQPVYKGRIAGINAVFELTKL